MAPQCAANAAAERRRPYQLRQHQELHPAPPHKAAAKPHSYGRRNGLIALGARLQAHGEHMQAFKSVSAKLDD